MGKLLKDIENNNENIIKIDLNEIEKIANPNIIEVHDCVILDLDNRIIKKNIDFDFILKRFEDRVGYEALCNEIRVNDYIIEGSFNSIVKLSFNVIDILKYKLKSKYPDDKFCIVFSSDKEYVTLRFYKIRENEKAWLNEEELDGYIDEAIMVHKF
ncbi:hypothetical protein [Clostridium baratii]|uniref:Uncharacterized protein n=1 Tax=Clostridium baratii TaxID=1561 RepID=A0A174RY58_9CLOT|nr:hypothetical protein [Clostridium baratii]OPF51158.1 hypothetical protein A1M12_01065 [Clostridium baratii]CUP87129.1 Uncharacterised protein [Clostridium baratii]